MDIIAYFVRWEDKYWGLFLAGLFVLLYVLVTDPACDGRRRKAALVIYGLAAYLLVLCPPVYRLLHSLGVSDAAYERLLHIWQYPVLLPVAAAVLADRAVQKKETGRAALFFGGLLLIFALAGSLGIEDLQAGTFSASLPDAQTAESYRLILADSDVRGQKAVIWGPADWMAESRMFNKDLYPVYGKDILQDPGRYSQTQIAMKDGYDRYEDPDSPLINKEDQLGAIANTLRLYPDQPCCYVAVYDPRRQGADVDADSVFVQCGYELTGVSGDLRIYHFNGVVGE